VAVRTTWLWKLRLGSASGRGGSRAARTPIRVRSGVVDQSCTRARTPAPIMVPVVVIIVATATAGVRDAAVDRAQMAWVFGMGRHEYRTMMRCVKHRALLAIGTISAAWSRRAPRTGNDCSDHDAASMPCTTTALGDAPRERRHAPRD